MSQIAISSSVLVPCSTREVRCLSAFRDPAMTAFVAGGSHRADSSARRTYPLRRPRALEAVAPCIFAPSRTEQSAWLRQSPDPPPGRQARAARCGSKTRGPARKGFRARLSCAERVQLTGRLRAPRADSRADSNRRARNPCFFCRPGKASDGFFSRSSDGFRTRSGPAVREQYKKMCSS